MRLLFTASKLCAFAVSVVLVSPLSLVCRVERQLWSRDLFYGPCTQVLSLVPGLPGIYLRAGFYFVVLQKCSWKVHVGFGSLLANWPARLSEHVTIGAYCVLGHVDIQPNVRIASRVSIPSGKRQHLDDFRNGSGQTHYDTVRIGTGCWIGEGAILMANIGRHSIVSAGAVVVDEVPEFSIVGGNPAKVIGKVDMLATSE